LNQTTRQRIVGTIVLVVAAVILLPAILDGEGSYHREIENRIPVAPPAPPVPTVTAQRPVVTADTDEILIDDEVERSVDPATSPATADAVSDSESTDPSPAQTAVSEVPRLDSRGLPEAWSVQLGAFSSQNNVRALVNRLQEAGYQAYTRPISSAQGELTGVFVGPKVDRAAALTLQDELAEAFDLSGRVVLYRIEEQ
jgi:DedD protein